MRENMEVGDFWCYYEAILLLQLDTEIKDEGAIPPLQTMIQVSIYIYISARKMDRLSKLEKREKCYQK